VAGAVLDCIPVDLTAIASIADVISQPLVFALRVLDEGTGNELIEQLPHGQTQTERHVLVNDPVRLLDQVERRAMRPVVVEGFTPHRRPACAQSVLQISSGLLGLGG
jgi:hypothetical protein